MYACIHVCVWFKWVYPQSKHIKHMFPSVQFYLKRELHKYFQYYVIYFYV
uniref:Uncharacterized protein n=1 Tax=Anguilla anguilla TaxID=7936 RepID=A0A0E9Q7G9_ANGAN